MGLETNNAVLKTTSEANVQPLAVFKTTKMLHVYHNRCIENSKGENINGMDRSENKHQVRSGGNNHRFFNGKKYP